MKKYTIGLQDDFGQWLITETVRAKNIENAHRRIGRVFFVGYNDFAVVADVETGETLMSCRGRDYKGDKGFVDNR